MLARWSGWGAVPGVFDERDERFVEPRAELRAMLDEDEYRAASRNTLNAHYTDAAYVQAVWFGLQRLGFEGGRVLEPGCGAGAFMGFAPPGAEMTGVGWTRLRRQSAGHCTPAALFWPRASPRPVPPKGSSRPRRKRALRSVCP